uniref:Uncharacterized protein n=1 Tax=Knipowitschia caucasica TaxID=637954 RepID=A0AAV2KIE9_KNICA
MVVVSALDLQFVRLSWLWLEAGKVTSAPIFQDALTTALPPLSALHLSNADVIVSSCPSESNVTSAQNLALKKDPNLHLCRYMLMFSRLPVSSDVLHAFFCDTWKQRLSTGRFSGAGSVS